MICFTAFERVTHMGHSVCLHLGNKCFDAGPVTFELFFASVILYPKYPARKLQQ